MGRSRQVTQAPDGRGPVFSPAQIWPWGFDPATISVLTQIRYGTQDVLSPPGNSEWLTWLTGGAG